MYRFEAQVWILSRNIWFLLRLTKLSSVPLFWTQTGYGLKPPPILSADRTHTQNLDVLKRHFQNTIPVYGPHVRFLTIELAPFFLKGRNSIDYRQSCWTKRQGRCYNSELQGIYPRTWYEDCPVCPCFTCHRIEWFWWFGFKISRIWLPRRDQRNEVKIKDCSARTFFWSVRLLRYENISNLIESMERTFETQGQVQMYWFLKSYLTTFNFSYFWMSDNVLFSQQRGVFRVNCIDCLDRTNVVQVIYFILA